VLRPSLPVALLGSLLVTAAFAALLLAGTGALRQQDPVRGGALLREGASSVQVASVPPAAKATRSAARRPARHAHRHAKRRAKRAHRVTFVPVAAVRRVSHRVPGGPPRHRAPARPHRPVARPKRTRKPRPKAPAPTPPTPTAPALVSADAPADELPATSTATAEASPPSTPTVAAPVAAPAPASKPAAPISVPAASPPTWHDWHRGDRDGRSRRGPCPSRGRHNR
jgi:hypothetical protein